MRAGEWEHLLYIFLNKWRQFPLGHPEFGLFHLKIKQSDILPAKMHLFGINRDYNSGPANFGKTIAKFNKQRRGTYFMAKKEEVGRGCFEGKSIAEKQELGVMTGSHCLGCGGSQFLVGHAMYIFSYWGLKLMILSCWGFFCWVCNWQSSCNWHWVLWLCLPASPEFALTRLLFIFTGYDDRELKECFSISLHHIPIVR